MESNLEKNGKFMQDDLQAAVDTLQKGGIILYPTDTVWGLGCDATNAEAVKRIFEKKKRADHKSMLVLLDTPAKLQNYVSEIPDMAWELIELTTKPLTIIYPKAKNLAENLVAEDGSIGIRITSENFSKALCQQFRKPIVSTSANISGMPNARCFNEISNEIKSAVDYIVQFRQNETELPAPSSIIKLDIGNVIKIIRP